MKTNEPDKKCRYEICDGSGSYMEEDNEVKCACSVKEEDSDDIGD